MTRRADPAIIEVLAPHIRRHSKKSAAYAVILAVCFGAFPYLTSTPSYRFAQAVAEFFTFGLIPGAAAWSAWWTVVAAGYLYGLARRDRRALVAAVYMHAIGSMIFAVAIAERTFAGQSSSLVGVIQWAWVAEHCYFVLRTPFRAMPDEPAPDLGYYVDGHR